MKIIQLLKSLRIRKKEKRKRKEVRCKAIAVYFSDFIGRIMDNLRGIWFYIVYIKDEQSIEFIEFLFILSFLLTNLFIILSL